MPNKSTNKPSRTLFAARVDAHTHNAGAIARKKIREQAARILSLEKTLARISKTAVSARLVKHPNSVQQSALDEIALSCAVELM